MVVFFLHKSLNLALVKIDNRHVVLFVLIAQGFPNCLISLARVYLDCENICFGCASSNLSFDAVVTVLGSTKNLFREVIHRSCNKIANGSHLLIVVLRRSQNLTSSRQISLSVYLNSERISDWREERGAVS